MGFAAIRSAPAVPGWARFVTLESSNHILLEGEPAFDRARRGLAEARAGRGMPLDEL